MAEQLVDTRRRGLDRQLAGQEADGLGEAGHGDHLDLLDHGCLGRAFARHQDAANAFLNFVLDPKESILISKEFPYSNPNAAALEFLKTEDPAAYAAYMGYPATNPPADFLANASPIKDVGDATALYDQLWTDFKGQ